MTKRLLGPTIYGATFVLFGLYGFLSIIMTMFFKQALNPNQEFSVYSPLFYLAQLIIGINVIKLKNWARIVAIFLYSIGTIAVAFIFFNTPIKTNIATVLLWPVFCLSFILFFASGIYYLNKRKIKEKFISK